MAVHDDRARSPRLPHHATNLGLAQPIHAHPFDRRRRRQRRRAGKAGCLDPINDTALWGDEDGVKWAVLCQRKVHRKFRTRSVKGGALRRRARKKKKGCCARTDSVTDAEGLSREKTRILPRLGAHWHWAHLAVSPTVNGFSALCTLAWMARTVMGGSNEPNMTTSP